MIAGFFMFKIKINNTWGRPLALYWRAAPARCKTQKRADTRKNKGGGMLNLHLSISFSFHLLHKPIIIHSMATFSNCTSIQFSFANTLPDNVFQTQSKTNVFLMHSFPWSLQSSSLRWGHTILPSLGGPSQRRRDLKAGAERQKRTK